MNAQPESMNTNARQVAALDTHFARVRSASEHLCASLAPEDTVPQSMPDASPVKWHLAHTTWFFEQFVLARDPDYQSLHPDWNYLFNSYYQSVGPMHQRPRRGVITRPTLAQVMDFRKRVDAAVQARLDAGVDEATAAIITIGLNHEQQHQELLLTDIKHLFSCNPLEPVYAELPRAGHGHASGQTFVDGVDGEAEIGHAGSGFAYDSEGPRHRVLLYPHAIARRLVTNAEYIEFIRDDGYRKPALWMSEGWDTVQREGWAHPLYWSDDLASAFTLGGRRELEPHAPVCHVSFYEADAFARWAGARLPTEAEWEVMAAKQDSSAGNFRDKGFLHPQAVQTDVGDGAPLQMFGDVWEWTSSPYVNYPGFRPLPGALGEYNGKFMCGQWVLRGGSCVTPADHIRVSYRNFFYPASRWQFTGIRLGRDA